MYCFALPHLYRNCSWDKFRIKKARKDALGEKLSQTASPAAFVCYMSDIAVATATDVVVVLLALLEQRRNSNENPIWWVLEQILCALCVVCT